MKAVVQRVRQAAVVVGEGVTAETVGAIGPGLLVLVCAERGDTPAHAERLVDKLLKLRIFSDADGRLNHPIGNWNGAGQAGGLLLVSQFTLAGDVWAGNRPSFTEAAPADEGLRLFNTVVERARSRHPVVATGRFGADMQIALLADGPVTLWMDVTISPRTAPPP